MKSVVVETPGKIAVVEREIPAIKENQVLVKVKAAGICGSDVHIFHGKNAFATYPRVVGHEFAGEIAKVGDQAGDFAVGEHVVVDPVVSCGHCYACRIGRHNVCTSLHVMGVHEDGGFQEYVAVNADQVYKLPADLPWEIAATVEPFSIGAQVAHRGRLSGDDTVLICGAGPIGLIILQVAKMKGARVAILDLEESRLEKAKEFGADIVMNPGKEDVVAKIKELTGGYGCDIYIEASGHPSSVQQGLDCIRKMGRFVEFSVFGQPVTVDWSIISDRKELDLLGVHLSPFCYDTVIEWIGNGKLPTEGVVTHKFPLEKWEEGFHIAKTGENGALKVVLVPDMEA